MSSSLNSEKSFLLKLKPIDFIIYSIIFTIPTIILIVLTIPDSTKNMKDYMDSIRTLLIGVGGGFFGLLGFIIASFTILFSQFSRIAESFMEKVKYGQLLQNRIVNFNKLKLTYKYTVILIFLEILIVFILYIITCIPSKFNEALFIACGLFFTITFYASVFSSFRFFVDGLYYITKENIDVIDRRNQRYMRKKQEESDEDMIDF